MFEFVLPDYFWQDATTARAAIDQSVEQGRTRRRLPLSSAERNFLLLELIKPFSCERATSQHAQGTKRVPCIFFS
jgi:hypothetical protein